jgi:hypothetical protein
MTGSDWLDWHIPSLCSVDECEDSVAGSSSATVNVHQRPPATLCLVCISDLWGIEVLDFLLMLSHGCRHPVDRIFACLCSPILCGVALWLAIETGLNLRTLADWSGRGFRGLVSSLSELHYSLRWPLGFFTWPGWLGDV